MNGQVETVSSLGVEYNYYGGLQYFGAMSASIAHEIKNALAITNENAGLMEDLSLIGIKSGQPLDPERIARLSKKVMEQVQRADNIVKKLSQFSHAVDDLVKVVNLPDLVELTLELGRRSAAAFSVTLESVKCDIPISIETNPFMLMNLLWLLIKSACRRVNSDKNIKVGISKEGKQITISIINLVESQLPSEDSEEQQNQIVKLAKSLNADVDMVNKDKIVITIKVIN